MEHKILLIIPAYNAAEYLEKLYRQVTEYFRPEDIVIINDGSSDDTSAILEKFDCRIIHFPRNRGKGAALKAGFQTALDHGYDAAITIDADLQHNPDHLPAFRKYYDRADIIIGTRAIDPAEMPWHRLMTNNLTSLIISIFCDTRVRDSQSGYRLLKRPVIAGLKLKSNRYDTESEMLLQSGYNGFKAAEIPIDTIYDGSRSSINPLPDTGRFIRQVWQRLWY